MTDQSDTETRLGPASAYAASEKELIWRYVAAESELNFHAQSYDFDVPKSGMFDSDDAIGNRVGESGDGYQDASDKLSAVEMVERHLHRVDPFSAHVLKLAYSPHGWPGFLRIAMSLGGDRDRFSLIGLLPLSMLAVGIRDRRRPPNTRDPGASLVDFFADMATKPENHKILGAVRDDLELILRYALAAYDQIRIQRLPHDRALKLRRREERADRDIMAPTRDRRAA